MSRKTGFWLTTILTSTAALFASGGLVADDEQFTVPTSPAVEQVPRAQVGLPAANRRCVWQSAWTDLQSFASAVRAARALSVLFDDDSRQPRAGVSDPEAPRAGREPSTLESRVSEMSEPDR